MKKTLLLFLLLGCLLLTACGMTGYTSNDYYFTMKFPDDMTVFAPGEIKADDPRLAQYGLNAEDLQAFHADGGVYYGIGLQGDIYNEVTVNVITNDFSEELWILKPNDTQNVAELQDELIEGFNVNGVEVLQKGDFQQGKVHCVFLNLSSGAVDGIDAVYMATICNGLQYSVLYQSSGVITEEKEQDVHDIFDTFYITEVQDDPNDEPRDTTVLQAMLILIMLIIAVTMVVLVVRVILVHRKKDDEKEVYIPQFEDTLNKPKKGRKQ